MLFDYETLRVIWWFLLIILWLGFALTDGFDLGVGAILKLVAKSDTEKRIAINVLAPHWDGNQVWLILAAGAIFAAWPAVYGAGFSALYPAMMIALYTLFLRPVAFDYRSKLVEPRWRNAWDNCIIIAGTVPPLIFGIAVGNLLLGLPFEFDADLRPAFEGSFFGLFHPFAIICGLLGVLVFAMHGAAYLMLRTSLKVYVRARDLLNYLPLAVIALFALNGLILLLFVDGYQITSQIDPAGPSNPTLKTAVAAGGAWLHNYGQYPLTMLAPLAGFIGAFAVRHFAKREKPGRVFFFSAVSLVGVISTAAVSLFPFIIPSSLNPSHSLTIWDATSSHLTLTVMTYAAAVFVPILITYNLWCYYQMWGRVTPKFVTENDHTLY